jgi:Protein of unknown function (DUF3551)
MSFVRVTRGFAPRIAIAFALLATIAVTDSDAQRSARGRAPWCGNLFGTGMDDCNYYTFEQCLVSVSGVGGACARNPAVPLVEYDRPVRRQPRAYR